MRSHWKGVRSTQPAPPCDDAEDGHLTPTEPKHQDFIAKVYNVKQTLYSDQIVEFPETSKRGNKYQMCLHEIDSNTTWVEPMPSCTKHSMISARANGISRMRAAGLNPKHQILDNKASAKYKSAITNSGMTYQLVPPDDNRRNISEKAIQFWKDHFIAVLSGAAITFPLRLWFQFIPQAERQLLLLRQSNTNPKISSYAHLYGEHDYSALPFVPISMETLVHEKPDKRRTWAKHASKGWVLGTSPEHYIFWKIPMEKTHATIISNIQTQISN